MERWVVDSIWVHLVSAPGGSDFSVSALLLKASIVVQLVLVALFSMSVLSWWVIGFKALALKRARQASKFFLDEFWSASSLDQIWEKYHPERIRHSEEGVNVSPLAMVFQAGQLELEKLRRGHSGALNRDTISSRVSGTENIERALRRARNAESLDLESWTSFLATTASAAPFVGLFGTVWGIMESFLNIARKGTRPLRPLRQALQKRLSRQPLAFVAAIPAVIAYNWLTWGRYGS